MKNDNRKILLLILVLGLCVRLGLLVFFWDQPLKIVDETHYQKIGENIMNYHEFSYVPGMPTTFRPPLYPAFLAGIYLVTGAHPNAVRIVQILLSLGIIVILFYLARMLFDRRVAVIAALIFAIYPTFAFFTHLILTEVLFTFFLLLFIYLFVPFLRNDTDHFHEGAGKSRQGVDRGGWSILLAGLVLGLGALTRSILYPILFICICALLLAGRGAFIRRVKWAALITLGFVIIVGPWTLRNYALYKHVVVVDTMGGLNMYLGNYEHTPLNRAWAAIDLTGDKSWRFGHEEELSRLNDAQKAAWASGKALEFIRGHKLLTVKRDIIKAANFWGLEREVIGPIINGDWPQLGSKLSLLTITFFVFLIYCLVAVFSVPAIMAHLRLKNREILFLLVLIAAFMGMHSLTFGHSRYHLPLMPLLGMFASWTVLNLKTVWENRKTWRQRVAALLIVGLCAIWLREILIVEGARFLKNVGT